MTNEETMTNKEAKEVLQEQIDRYGQEYDAEGIEALEIAIKVLEQQPCEDCVSREYIEPIVEELENICINGDEQVLSMLADIKNAPPVTPQQETGKWIKEGEEEDVVGFRWTSRRCSKCGWTHCLVIPNNYCPNCGTKMEVEE